MRSVTLGDVAAHAGVSRGTVSNVMNHPERVSPHLRERVESTMSELGFVRNESARQLRSGSSSSLALSLLDTWNPYFNDVTRGIEERVYDGGWTLSVSTSALSRDRERHNLEIFQQRRVRGILAVPISAESIAQLEKMSSRGLSCVLVDRRADGYGLPSVSVDDVEGGRLAGAHLRSLGKSRIMFAGNPDVHTHAADRLAGLRQALGPDRTVELINTESVTLADGIAVGTELARRRRSDRPEALFCANDLVAIGVMQALIRARISLPEEIAIVGYDDIEFASQVAVPLTTVRQPAHELGRKAAQLLLADIANEGSSDPVHHVYEPQLVVRESTTARELDSPG
ncbi:LacI family DNA-binding transcriptional regulator [Streptomyces canus]|uniref:LacI family DNA-binding transcriptional regulator n=1 Tax=Streptomyces TaxID=1883 RepID=UPI000851E3D1|nr:LacI family DNA-binding transcriptional regulator [Streptomyces sp. LUP47B]